MTVYTHDMINISQTTGTGLLSMPGILWGANALQTINITRNTPAEKAQAVGHLGIVDYVSGVITSEVTLDCVLVEAAARVNPAQGASAGQPSSSIYRYAAVDVTLGTESYVLVSFGMSCSAGQPITVNFGYLTPTIASELGIQTRPAAETGEESSYAVVMGDDGSGLILVPTWQNGAPSAVVSTNIPVMTSSGALNISDQGLPGGVQSMNFSGKINRDHVLDVRSAQPVAFVTTYPLDMTCEMDVFNPPQMSGLTPAQVYPYLQGISLQASNYNKHPSPSGAGTPPTAGAAYLNAIGFRMTANGESVSISKYLSHTVSFIVADLDMPLPTV
jgi:hypothetical protein